jgi:hypothetical protein
MPLIFVLVTVLLLLSARARERDRNMVYSNTCSLRKTWFETEAEVILFANDNTTVRP